MQKHCGRKHAKGRRKVRERFRSQSQQLLLQRGIAGPLRAHTAISRQDCFGFHGQKFESKYVRTCCSAASPATLSTEAPPVLLLSSSVSLSIHVHQIASGADVAERIFAKGACKERERRTWPGKVVGHSGFREKASFLFQRMSNCRPSCGEAPCKPVTSLA